MRDILSATRIAAARRAGVSAILSWALGFVAGWNVPSGVSLLGEILHFYAPGACFGVIVLLRLRPPDSVTHLRQVMLVVGSTLIYRAAVELAWEFQGPLSSVAICSLAGVLGTILTATMVIVLCRLSPSRIELLSAAVSGLVGGMLIGFGADRAYGPSELTILESLAAYGVALAGYCSWQCGFSTSLLAVCEPSMDSRVE